MARERILIIEDEASLVEVLTYNLKNEGYEVLSARNGQEGLELAQQKLPDLILLDLMLPGLDGLQVCRHLRSNPKTENIRIMMLTAKSEEIDEVIGFNMGADDYVAKPFKLKPLIHRIKAHLRQPSREPDAQDVINSHGIEIDRLHHTARADGKELNLTLTEFKLLWMLASHPGRPFSRYELLDTSRGVDANSLERTIDVHIRSLRQKLGDKSDLVETVRGVGYRFSREA
ncbi:MAG: response regulator [Planctomycetaceae bacterium]|nr:response regulator [Planctomycetaceae bacterium]